MLAGNLPGDGSQAFEALTFVLKHSFGGDRDPVFTVAPFTHQHGSRGEVKLLRAGAQFDLRMLSTDGLQASAGLRRKRAKGFFLNFVGNTLFDEGPVWVERAGPKMAIPEAPEFRHR